MSRARAVLILAVAGMLAACNGDNLFRTIGGTVVTAPEITSITAPQTVYPGGTFTVTLQAKGTHPINHIELLMSDAVQRDTSVIIDPPVLTLTQDISIQLPTVVADTLLQLSAVVTDTAGVASDTVRRQIVVATSTMGMAPPTPVPVPVRVPLPLPLPVPVPASVPVRVPVRVRPAVASLTNRRTRTGKPASRPPHPERRMQRG